MKKEKDFQGLLKMFFAEMHLITLSILKAFMFYVFNLNTMIYKTRIIIFRIFCNTHMYHTAESEPLKYFYDRAPIYAVLYCEAELQSSSFLSYCSYGIYKDIWKAA